MVREFIDPRAMRDAPSQVVARNMVFVSLAALAATEVRGIVPGDAAATAVTVAMIILFVAVIAHVHTMTMRAVDWLTRRYSDDHR